jgi:hypothetical protein
MRVNRCNQLITDAGFAIEMSEPDTAVAIKLLVGYHNYYRVNFADAVQWVQDRIVKSGLNARYFAYAGSRYAKGLPQGAVCVGQFKVHSGDCETSLYVVPLAR